MHSGVVVHPMCVDSFDQLKMQRRTRFMIMSFNKEDSHIEVKHEELWLARRQLDKKYTTPEVLRNTLNAAISSSWNNHSPSSKDLIFILNKHWLKMVNILPETDVAYVVSYIHFKVENRLQTKIVFILWAPEDAPVRRKMLVASSAATLKRALVGIHKSIQANGKSDLSLEGVIAGFLRAGAK